jgi:hypothetical protein
VLVVQASDLAVPSGDRDDLDLPLLEALLERGPRGSTLDCVVDRLADLAVMRGSIEIE